MESAERSTSTARSTGKSLAGLAGICDRDLEIGNHAVPRLTGDFADFTAEEG